MNLDTYVIFVMLIIYEKSTSVAFWLAQLYHHSKVTVQKLAIQSSETIRCAVPFAYVSLQVLADEQRAVRSQQLETGASLHLETIASQLN